MTAAGNNFEPVHARLKAIEESKFPPSVRLTTFQREVRPSLPHSRPSEQPSEAQGELLNSTALVLRAISMSAWNEHHDADTAQSANVAALRYALDGELRQRLLADQKAMMEQAAAKAARKATEARHLRTGLIAFLMVAAVVVVAAMAYSSSSSEMVLSHPPRPRIRPGGSGLQMDSAPRPSVALLPVATPPGSSPKVAVDSGHSLSSLSTPAPAASPGEKHRISVPEEHKAELDHDQQALAYEKAKATSFQEQLRQAKEDLDAVKAALQAEEQSVGNMNAELASEHIALDHSNLAAVKAVNQKIKVYNAAVAELRIKHATVLRSVDDYNALLTQVRDQDDVVHAKVDEFNAKLRRYGQ